MATRQKHNIYIYNRVVTEYFYAKIQYYGLLSRPNKSRHSECQKSKYFYQIYLYYKIHT